MVTVPSSTEEFEVTTLRQAFYGSPDPNARPAWRQYGVTQDAYSSVWCKFIWAYNAMQELDDAVILVHAPLNCSSCVRTFKTGLYHNWGNPFIHSPTTDMTKDHVIFGGNEELLQAILAVDRDYRPNLIVILTGCAPGLTLDDMERVVGQAQPLVKARLWQIPSAGFEFKNNGYFEDVLPLWLDFMQPQPAVHKDWVNILGNNREPYCRARDGKMPYGVDHDWITDAEEMGRLVELMGLRVHRIVPGDRVADLQDAPAAGLNVVTCASNGMPLALGMAERFGTPYIPFAQPLGPISTAKWLRLVGEATGRQELAEGVIAREYEAIRPIWEACREMVQGKTAILMGWANRPFSIGRMCQELGMDVYHLGSRWLRFKSQDTQHWLSTGYDCKYVLRKTRDVASVNMVGLLGQLGLKPEDVVYFYFDFPPYARAGRFDAANVARVDTGVHQRRFRGWNSRGGLGYRGAASLCIMMMEAVKAARRQTAPTLHGRLYGKSLEYEMS